MTMSPRSAPLTAALVFALCGAALAQDQPAGPGPEVRPGAIDPAALQQGRPRATNGRRAMDGPPTKLAFKNVTVEQIVPFIVEATGKVVMPQQDVLTRKITVLNDQEIPRAQALDLVLMALQQNNVAVVETDLVVTLRDISEITRQSVPVLGPDESTLERTDVGAIAEKVFRLKYSSAENYGEILKGAMPDYAKMTVDKDSNQLAIVGNIALLQRMERLITSLDKPSSNAVEAETFTLKYADAEQIAQNIRDLFDASTTGAQRGNQNRNNQQGGQRGQQNQPQPFFRFGDQQNQATSTSGEIRVSSNAQQNSVTVVADPAIIEQIRRQIEDYWDKKLPEDVVIPKIYDLVNSDPVKVRDLLENLFGRGTPGGPAGGNQGGGGQNQGGQNRQSTGSTQGIGRLAGQFSFEAIPEANRLVVVAKSPENLAVIDKIIADLDKVQSAGLPAIVELKHASAEDLAEQLNALLAQDGTLAQIRRAASGLSTSSTTSASPFSTEQATTGQQPQEQTAPDMIGFWWQRSRPPTDKNTPSNLIAQVRLVPVWRQNALMVLAPVEYRNAIVQLVADLDKPGRQVLLSAIVAEVQRDDATALGLRWSSQALTPTNGDNSISIGSNAQGTENNFARSLFDTSVLNVNTNLNVLLQALAQKTSLAILSEPKIFTSDNQEAEFFSGQDIPFVTDSQSTDTGNIIQSFDYRAVGIALRVRPRITVQRDVDLRVNVELSSIVPGQTLFGGFIVDRRETTTQVIIENGQTIVVSGLLRSENSDIVRKVPLLGDIPLLGAIFRSTEKTKRNIELLIFITPVVVDNPEESHRVNEPYNQRLEERFRPQLTEPKAAPELRGPAPMAPEVPPREVKAEPAPTKRPKRGPAYGGG
jgi:general secretion pathway protein D